MLTYQADSQFAVYALCIRPVVASILFLCKIAFQDNMSLLSSNSYSGYSESQCCIGAFYCFGLQCELRPTPFPKSITSVFSKQILHYLTRL